MVSEIGRYYYNNPIKVDVALTIVIYAIFVVFDLYVSWFHSSIVENQVLIFNIMPAIISLLGFTIAAVSVLTFLFEDRYFGTLRSSPHFSRLFEANLRAIVGFVILLPLLILPLITARNMFSYTIGIILLFFFSEVARGAIYLRKIIKARIMKIKKENERKGGAST